MSILAKFALKLHNYHLPNIGGETSSIKLSNKIEPSKSKPIKKIMHKTSKKTRKDTYAVYNCCTIIICTEKHRSYSIGNLTDSIGNQSRVHLCLIRAWVQIPFTVLLAGYIELIKDYDTLSSASFMIWRL